MRRGLFLKYVVLFVGLVGGVLVINAALDLYFVDQDNRRASIEVQKEKAEAAAQRVESFVRDIERQIRWVAYTQFESLPTEQRYFEYNRMQLLVPAITELAQLDRAGREQLKVSRIGLNSIASNLDRSADPAFVEAVKNKVYFSPVDFRKESEPYLTMAVAHGRGGGVTVADVNLKFILDPISEIKVGKEGYAYVVDRLGRLIAHRDISLVLRGTDMKQLPQVEAALKTPGDNGQPADATNRRRAGPVDTCQHSGTRLAGVRRGADRGGPAAGHRRRPARAGLAGAGLADRGRRRRAAGAAHGGADPRHAGRCGAHWRRRA